MTESWVNWTVAECQLPGRSGAAGRATFIGEGPAVESFARGTLDVAYSAGGYHDAMGLAPADPALPDGGRRAAVNIPTGLNATVLAVFGGYRQGPNKIPYRDIKLTAAEVAKLVSGGNNEVEKLRPEVDIRNPELAASSVYFDFTAPFPLAAYADADASTWYITRWLQQVAPDAWKVPDNNLFDEKDRGKPRGVDVSFALASPSYIQSITLLTGRSALRKGLSGNGPTSDGGVWVVTDLVTAKALGMTPVKIQNTNGAFVEPTPETLAAAVPKMVADDHGILVPDPKAVAPQDQVQPYPLTFVEYALSPAEALMDGDCAPRAGSQALLTGWLNYVTGPGQERLPAGMVPLTADLRAQAVADIPKVGAAKVTGTCAETASAAATTTSTTPAVTTTVAPAASGGDGTASAQGGTGSQAGSGAGTGGAAASVGPAASTPPVSSAAVNSKPAGDVEVPPFGGRRATAFGGTVVALLGLMALSSMSGFRSAPARLASRWRGSRPGQARPGQGQPGQGQPGQGGPGPGQDPPAATGYG